MVANAVGQNGDAWSYDNLNRMNFSPYESYAHDILGRRLVSDKNWIISTFDPLGRMDFLWSVNSSGVDLVATYGYRADGLRRWANHMGWLLNTVYYAYDGQMPIFSWADDRIDRNMLGARGIDATRTTENGVTATSFPLYDGHGNVKASLVRSGVDGFATSGWKAYDVWGGLLQGNGFLGEHGYCGNLGHISDPSGAIYMRARYYEPWTGRFLSEDPARDGQNWYAYCGNDPMNFVDSSGEAAEWTQEYQIGLYSGIGTVIGAAARMMMAFRKAPEYCRPFMIASLVFLLTWYSSSGSRKANSAWFYAGTGLFMHMLFSVNATHFSPPTSISEKVKAFYECYGSFISLFLAAEALFAGAGVYE